VYVYIWPNLQSVLFQPQNELSHKHRNSFRCKLMKHLLWQVIKCGLWIKKKQDFSCWQWRPVPRNQTKYLLQLLANLPCWNRRLVLGKIMQRTMKLLAFVLDVVYHLQSSLHSLTT
jgi:hypothetical protein